MASIDSLVEDAKRVLTEAERKSYNYQSEARILAEIGKGYAMAAQALAQAGRR